MTDQVPAPPAYRFWGSQKPRVLAAAAPKTVGSTATIRVYGPIDSWGGFWGTSAKEVAEALDELDDSVETVQLRLNSPGGDAFEGVAIMNLLRAHKAHTVAVVDGLAASAASIIATGCDELVMSPGSELMVHDASTVTFGDAAEMDKAHRMLDSVSNTIASVYAAKAGGTLADWRAVMVAETWYTAQEAVDAGLADRTDTVRDAGSTETAGAEPAQALPDGSVENAFDLSIFNYAGRSHAPAPKPPSASAVGSTPTQEGSPAVAFSDEQVTTMRQKLGIAEDADEATILAALTEALDEQATEPKATTATAQIPDGHVVIPAAKLADLEAGAAQASATAKRLADEDREAFLDSVRTKYAPANRAAWAKEYDRDPKGTREHFATAPELIPVTELGDGDQPETSNIDADVAAFASALGIKMGA